MFEAFQMPSVQRGLVEIALLAIGAGLAGTWIVLRGLAFYSHATATATFPGLVLAETLGFAALLGAFAAALVYAIALGGLIRPRRSGYDSVTALSLAGALALGVILSGDSADSHAHFEDQLFGSLLQIGTGDLVVAAAASVVVLIGSWAFGRSWIAAGFDDQGARALGLATRLHDWALLLLIAVMVVSMLAALGVLLATSLLVVPAATTRLFTSDIRRWQLATIGLVALEGIAGLWLAVEIDAPPSATIALLAGAVFTVCATARTFGNRTTVASVNR